MFSVYDKKYLGKHVVHGVMNSSAGYPMFLIYDLVREDFIWKYASEFFPESYINIYVAKREVEEKSNEQA